MLKHLNVEKLPGPFLIVAPHLDDDILGTGGLIQVAQAHGKQVYVLYITAGDANGNSVKHYLHKPLLPRYFRELGYIRHHEAIQAERVLGVPKSHLFFLAFPDSLTLKIITDPKVNRVHQSPLTRLSKAAYTFAYRRNAPYTHKATGPVVPPAGLRLKPPVTLPLTPEEVKKQRLAFSKMRSQASRYYRRFFRRNELFWRT